MMGTVDSYPLYQYRGMALTPDETIAEQGRDILRLRQSRKRCVLAAKSRRCSYHHLKAAVQNLSIELAALRRRCEWHKVEDELPEPNRQLIITVRREFTGATVICKNPATMTRAGEWRFRGGDKVLLEKRGIVAAWRYWPEIYQPKEAANV